MLSQQYYQPQGQAYPPQGQAYPPPEIPYHIPRPPSQGIKALKPTFKSATLDQPFGMTTAEYQYISSQVYATNPQAVQEWEIAQGYQRSYQAMYGLTY